MTAEQPNLHSMSGKLDHIDAVAMAHPSSDGSPDISTLIEPYRRELHLHCYRLLGSLLDAEDLVQETMLRAWQRFDSFRGASSLRTWLYTIATNACLDVLKKRLPRTLPQVSYPMADPRQPISPPIAEAIWLEPFPDLWLAEAPDNPEAHYTRRESVSLAFLTALQLLPPRQRAILILSDVLDWRAREIADLLELTVSAVNSALHRARTTLEKNYHAEEPGLIQMDRADAAISALLNRYVRAWETDDVDGLVALLKEDATFSMPPFPSWYVGRKAIGGILAFAAFAPGLQHQWRMFPTNANEMPAFALYRADKARTCYRAFGIQVISLDNATPEGQIAEITIFNTPGLLPHFGFPPQLPV